jgi:hypothetical protein
VLLVTEMVQEQSSGMDVLAEGGGRQTTDGFKEAAVLGNETAARGGRFSGYCGEVPCRFEVALKAASRGGES